MGYTCKELRTREDVATAYKGVCGAVPRGFEGYVPTSRDGQARRHLVKLRNVLREEKGLAPLDSAAVDAILYGKGREVTK